MMFSVGAPKIWSSVSLTTSIIATLATVLCYCRNGQSFTTIRYKFANRQRTAIQYFYFYRQDAAKRQTAGIVFTHRPKIRFFAPTGATRCTDSGQTVQYRRAPGSAWLCKISRLSVQRGGNAAPKISKISTFWFGKESPRRGDSLDRFGKFLGAFIRLTVLH